METVFNSSLKGMTKKEQTQAYWDRNNKLDIKLKQRRDEETGTLTVVDDLNHTLKDFGDIHFSYSNDLFKDRIQLKSSPKTLISTFQAAFDREWFENMKDHMNLGLCANMLQKKSR